MDEAIWEKFKAEAAKTKGRLWRVIPEELSYAIKLYLKEKGYDIHTQTHTLTGDHTIIQPKMSMKYSKLNIVKQELSNTFQVGCTFSKDILEKIIINKLNITDARSIKSRINRLIAEGFIEVNYDKDIGGQFLILKGNMLKTFPDEKATPV